ncbi:MAG: hypothetical protein Q9214_004429 [Letrouitia sp. 1 TL-2023]
MPSHPSKSEADRHAPFAPTQELFSLPPLQSPVEPDVSEHFHPTKTSALKVVLPAIFWKDDQTLHLIDASQRDSIRDFVSFDLSVDRIEKFYKHLWLAGLPQLARPLHYHRMLHRKIIVTERADLHLLWQDDWIFIKPLPDYIMSHGVWSRAIQQNQTTFNSARGFLLSYLWLINRESDFAVAQSEKLISNQLKWEQWRLFSATIAPNLAFEAFKDISPRYRYGELRLNRINWIYRLCSKTRNLQRFARGYFYTYRRYTTFLQRNFAWVLTAIAYVAIMLSAMQVGLGTIQLKENKKFNRVSYGFTVFSLVLPLAIFLIAALVLLFLILINFIYLLHRRKSAELSSSDRDISLRPYAH